MPNIPGVTGYAQPQSWDPIPPYKWGIIQIYNLLLKQGESVVICNPVMYEGKHVMGMYDLEITNLNDKNPGKYPDGTIAPVRIRLRPTEPLEWNLNSWEIEK